MTEVSQRAREAAWNAWPSADDYPEREAFEAGYSKAERDALAGLVEAANAVLNAYEGPDALSFPNDRKEIDRRFMVLKEALRQHGEGK